MKRRLLMAAAAIAAIPAVALAGPVKSAGQMTFADPNTLIVADWRAGELHALSLPSAHSQSVRPFNLKNVSTPIARALGVSPLALRFEDMAVRPGAELAYLSLTIARPGRLPSPALVSVDSTGHVAVIDLAKVPRTTVKVSDTPSPDKSLWREPEATLTFTDLVAHGGKLYVAGLSNETFASTLRVFDLPLKRAATVTSIEMYHPVHNQIETRAPIRKMTIVDTDAGPLLVAAFTCTPLAVVPVKDLKDGAHIAAKTIAELGWGSAPVDMVTFDTGQGQVVLLTNSHKSADLMPVADIAAQAAQPGLTTPIDWPAHPLLGLKSVYTPISNVDQLAVQDKDFLAVMRRDQASGAMQLVSIRKAMLLRVSDFVNEYDFADYKYAPGDPTRNTHHQLRVDEGYPDLAQRTFR
ncbi:hypothetical protein BH10PSE4_BH10PSE4_33370 [soil metagenome]